MFELIRQLYRRVDDGLDLAYQFYLVAWSSALSTEDDRFVVYTRNVLQVLGTLPIYPRAWDVSVLPDTEPKT
jgi:hypothetical protein